MKLKKSKKSQFANHCSVLQKEMTLRNSGAGARNAEKTRDTRRTIRSKGRNPRRHLRTAHPLPRNPHRVHRLNAPLIQPLQVPRNLFLVITFLNIHCNSTILFRIFLVSRSARIQRQSGQRKRKKQKQREKQRESVVPKKTRRTKRTNPRSSRQKNKPRRMRKNEKSKRKNKKKRTKRN